MRTNWSPHERLAAIAIAAGLSPAAMFFVGFWEAVEKARFRRMS